MQFGIGKPEGLDVNSMEACKICNSLVSYSNKCSFAENLSVVLGASED